MIFLLRLLKYRIKASGKVLEVTGANILWLLSLPMKTDTVITKQGIGREKGRVEEKI